MSHETPDWSSLPHDPESFFGLEPGYSARDLKLAYHKLIRQFKPEKCPAEFQKIRAAYESLEDRNRFLGSALPPGVAPAPTGSSGDGAPTSMPSSTAETGGLTPNEIPLTPLSDQEFRGQPAPMPAPSARPAPKWQGAFEGQSRAVPMLARGFSLEEIQRRLEHSELLNTGDVVALAVLDEMANPSFVPKFWGGFGKRLAERAGQGHGGRAILELLRELITGLDDVGERASAIVYVAKRLSPDAFAYVTRRAWMRLVRETNFNGFSKTWRAAWETGKGIFSEAHHRLLLDLFPLLVWRAPREWIEETYGAISDAELFRGAAVNSDVYDLLLDYARHRDSFRALGPITERIDGILRAFFFEEDEVGLRLVLEGQEKLLSSIPELVDTIHPDLPGLEIVLSLWEFMTESLCERMGVFEVDEKLPLEEISELLLRRERRGDYWTNINSLLAGLGVTFLLAGGGHSLVILIYKTVRAGLNANWMGLAIDGVLALIVATIVTVGVLLIRRFRRKTAGASRDFVREFRIDMLRTLRNLSISAGQLAQVVYAMAHYGRAHFSKPEDLEVVARAMLTDPAIPFICGSSRCLKADSLVATPELQRAD